MLMVEDGTGKADANSYISIADADTYNTNWVNNSTWTNAADAEKERMLLQAARYIDTFDYVAIRLKTDQALAWPRTVGYIDGKYYYGKVPVDIKNAQVEVAIKLIDGLELFSDSDGETIKSESDTVGPLSHSRQYASTKKDKKQLGVVYEMIKKFLQGNRVVRSIG